jgi:DNA-binding protein H-NS
MKNKPLHELSETELAELVENAQKALQDRQQGKRKEVLAEIKALAASIGVTIEFSNSASPKGSTRKGTTVPIKYRNPASPSETWTGRGVKPRWLKALIEQGRRIEEFAV